jgi:hypothetical protein
MSNALTYAVVHCDERPLRAERVLHGAAEPLGVAEDRAELFGGQVNYRLAVRAGDDEDVARKERTRVEKGDARIVLDHKVGWDLTGGNSAERTPARRHLSESLLRAAASR